MLRFCFRPSEDKFGACEEMILVLESIELAERDTPDYIEVDTSKKIAKLVRVPALADVPYAVKMEPNLVVEYYSR